MLTLRRRLKRLNGLTAIELLTTIALIAILMAIGVPSLTDWVRSNKVMAAANTLKNGIRSAQSDALTKSQPIVFILTNTKLAKDSKNFTANTNGKYWASVTIPGLMAGETAAMLNSGNLNDVADGVTITGPASICFNSLGRLMSNSSPGPTGAACSLPTKTAEIYDIEMTGAKRRLRVTVSIAGQVRMCDRDKDISTHADGCPS